MDKVNNQLFLNYLRSIGRPFKAKIAGVDKIIPTGAIHAFPEVLVPGASSAEHDMLTALANSLYLEARSHNMSLAPYGHLDPVKIAIAGTFIGVLMSEVLGDLSVIGVYQFGNVYFGRALAAARNIQLVATEDEFANLCKKFNMLVAKVNSLYIPITGFARRWYEHRRNIYRDDEGDRYSLYTYYLINYYEYIVDPTDSNAGRLICRGKEHTYAASGEDDLTVCDSILDKIARIEALVNNYLSDDDVANFCTEALNAGLPHLTFAPLKSVIHDNGEGSKVEKFVGPELKLVYDLDDILGLENSCFVSPTFVKYGKNYPAAWLNQATWDIYEDVTTGTLICGNVGSTRNVLPAFTISKSSTRQGVAGFDISHRPIFTHAKVTSLPGLTCLTRYIVATGAAVTMSPTTIDPASVITYENGVAKEISALSGYPVVPITVHGTEMLCGHICITFESNNLAALVTYTSTRFMQTIYATSAAVSQSYMEIYHKMNLGFKARFITYRQISDAIVPVIADFDYVTSVTDDSLSEFFGANAWNDTMLISKLDSTESKDKQKEAK